MRLTCLVLLSLPASAFADHWPGWRGPAGQGVANDKGYVTTWSQTENIKWKIPLPGAGVSTPIVWGNHVFLTSSHGRLNDRLTVYAFDRRDGKQLWHTRLFGSSPTDLYAPGGMAVPTPCTDGKLLYVLFGTGDLAALDFQGNPVWIRSLAEEYGPFRNRWGMGASPILVKGKLIVQVDHWSQSYLLAVEPRTGKNLWKTDRTAAVNWSTPAAVQTKDGTQIVAIGTHHVRGYDAGTGAEMWWAEGTHQQCIPSPVSRKDLVIACSGTNTLAIKLDGATGDLTKSNVAWTNKKAGAFIPSPVLADKYLYVPLDKGFTLCLDAETGEQLWRERLGDSFHASPIVAEGRVYFFSKSGLVNVVKAGAKFEELSRNDLGEEIIAGPAFSAGDIFLRTGKHLYCIGRK